MSEPLNPYSSPESTGRPPAAESPAEIVCGSLRGPIWGLRVVFFGLLAMTVAQTIIAAYTASILAVSSDAVIKRLFMLLNFGKLLGIVGVLLCLSTPREVRATKFIRVAAAAAVINFSADMYLRLPFLFRNFHMAFLWSRAAQFAAFLLTATIEISFLLYLKQLAWFVHRRKLIVGAQRLLGFAIALIAYQFWDAGYFDWDSPAPVTHADFITHEILRLVWPLVYALAAILIQGLCRALLEKERRRVRALTQL